MLAAQAIQCGDASVIVAGGMESMAARLTFWKRRNGYRLGHGELVDSVLRDALTDAYSHLHMGICGDRCVPNMALPANNRMILPSPAISVPEPLPQAVSSRGK